MGKHIIESTVLVCTLPTCRENEEHTLPGRDERTQKPYPGIR